MTCSVRSSIGIGLVAFCIHCQAQAPVAPTPDQAGSPRGDDWSGFNIVNSFETGYRFLSTSGNLDTYRSHENYGNGVRLLSSFFSMNSKDGHGRLFDEIVLTTEGLGGDPTSSANLRVQKNRIYEYNLLWRNSEYFNSGLVTDGGAGEHLLDTTYTLQDHNVMLFPQSWISVSLGYTRDAQGGAGISTAQLFNPLGEFDPSGNVFSLFTNVKLLQSEYRLGARLRFFGLTLDVTHGWEDYKDDTGDQFNGSSSGDAFNPNAVLNVFTRAQPNHGASPYWRAALLRHGDVLSVNARYTYTGGQRAFIANENAIGTNQFGVLANQQILTFGDAQRPVTTANLSVSIVPLPKLTIVENGSFYDVKTDGESAYLQFNNATQVANLLYFQYLGIRTFASQTDILYRLRSWLAVHGGYQYSNRTITSDSQFALSGTSAALPYSQNNELNSGTLGLNIRPIKPLTITLDSEIGHANHPFTPKSDRNYTALDGRVQYKFKALQLLASSHSDYNANSITLSDYSSHSRIYSGSVSWSPVNWFALDASYSKIHVDALGGIQFFANAQLFANQFSYYISNLHSGTLGVRLSPLKRIDLYLGYSRVQDTGDGRSNPLATVVGPNLAAFQTAQTFPLTFQSPLVRVSLRISERVRWNAGYQYFGYRANFSPVEDYLAHTGYTSVTWSF